MNASNLFLSLILHLGNLFLIVQLHFSKLFLILKSGVNHTSRGSISTSTLPSIKLRKCSSKIITSILSFISGRLATKSNQIKQLSETAEVPACNVPSRSPLPALAIAPETKLGTASSGLGTLEPRSEERRVGKECRSRWS